MPTREQLADGAWTAGLVLSLAWLAVIFGEGMEALPIALAGVALFGVALTLHLAARRP